MSGYGSSRRYDVVAEARRRWSDAEKRAIAAEAMPPGTIVSVVARRHGISPSLLFRWLKTHGPLGDSARPSKPHFLPVAIQLPAPAAGPIQPADAPTVAPFGKPAPVNTTATGIEIALANGRCIRVSAGADFATLKAVIDLLEAR